MLSADVLIQDIDATGWANLVSLADPNVLRELANEPKRPPQKRTRLLIIFEGDKALKAYHSEKGSILDGFEWNGPHDLESLARREKGAAVVAIERGSTARVGRGRGRRSASPAAS